MYYFQALFAILSTSFLLFSCSPETKSNPDPAQQASIQQNKYEIVPNKKVCMVNDRFMGIDQIPIEVDGVTYYGCCQDCVKKIQENLGEVRYSRDPVSGERVDKATAIIVRNRADGSVYYFSTNASADQFLQQ